MEEESDLQKLNSIDDNDIRPEFVDQISKLRTKVFRKVKPKKLNGQFLNGQMIIELAKAYVDAINTGRVPTIESAWDYMCAEENHKAAKSSMEIIKLYSQKIKQSLPVDSNEILKHKELIFKEAEENFCSNTLSGLPKEAEKEFLTKIRAFLDDTFVELETMNNDASTNIIKKYFESNFRDQVRQNLRNDKYDSTDDYEKDLEIFKEQFREEFNGNHFEKFLDQILHKFNERVFKDISAVKTRKLELELTAFRERTRRAEEELISGKEELGKDKERYNIKIQELENERIQNLSKIEIITEKLKSSQNNQNEKIEHLEDR